MASQTPARRIADLQPVPPPVQAAPQMPVASAPRPEESKLIVGRNIRLKGEISACDVLVVEGEVEASINCRLLEVVRGGVFRGNAEVETAEVHDLVRRFWGHLPDKLRDEMQSSLSEQFLPKYEQLIEDYYRRLAEDRRGRP